jgi:ribosome-binding factor A
LGISITDVKVDREVSYADVYVSALEGIERSKEILQALEHAQGFLRHELAQRIEVRTFPRLRFHWDATFERADRIERLIASLHVQAEQTESDSPAPPLKQEEADDAV